MAKGVEDEVTTTSPLIIAMKGHPGTGKSTLARALASTLKIPLIDKDDIRDCTLLLRQQKQLAPQQQPQVNQLSYEVIWRLASTQLRLGLSVIIDSPLSRRTHLDRLIELAAASGARLVVVECRPLDEERWRERIEGREERPLSWEELRELIKRYNGCWDYDVGDVPKMVVNTTAPGLGVEELVSSVMHFIASSSGR